MLYTFALETYPNPTHYCFVHAFTFILIAIGAHIFLLNWVHFSKGRKIESWELLQGSFFNLAKKKKIGSAFVNSWRCYYIWHICHVMQTNSCKQQANFRKKKFKPFYTCSIATSMASCTGTSSLRTFCTPTHLRTRLSRSSTLVSLCASNQVGAWSIAKPQSVKQFLLHIQN